MHVRRVKHEYRQLGARHRLGGRDDHWLLAEIDVRSRAEETESLMAGVNLSLALRAGNSSSLQSVVDVVSPVLWICDADANLSLALRAGI